MRTCVQGGVKVRASQRDPLVLARHRHSRVKASAQEIANALTGNWRDEHLFVLCQALAMYDDIAKHLIECDAKWNAPRIRSHRDRPDPDADASDEALGSHRGANA